MCGNRSSKVNESYSTLEIIITFYVYPSSVANIMAFTIKIGADLYGMKHNVLFSFARIPQLAEIVGSAQHYFDIKMRSVRPAGYMDQLFQVESIQMLRERRWVLIGTEYGFDSSQQLWFFQPESIWHSDAPGIIPEPIETSLYWGPACVPRSRDAGAPPTFTEKLMNVFYNLDGNKQTIVDVEILLMALRSFGVTFISDPLQILKSSDRSINRTLNFVQWSLVGEMNPTLVDLLFFSFRDVEGVNAVPMESPARTHEPIYEPQQAPPQIIREPYIVYVPVPQNQQPSEPQPLPPPPQPDPVEAFPVATQTSVIQSLVSAETSFQPLSSSHKKHSEPPPQSHHSSLRPSSVSSHQTRRTSVPMHPIQQMSESNALSTSLPSQLPSRKSHSDELALIERLERAKEEALQAARELDEARRRSEAAAANQQKAPPVQPAVSQMQPSATTPRQQPQPPPRQQPQPPPRQQQQPPIRRISPPPPSTRQPLAVQSQAPVQVSQTLMPIDPLIESYLLKQCDIHQRNAEKIEKLLKESHERMPAKSPSIPTSISTSVPSKKSIVLSTSGTGPPVPPTTPSAQPTLPSAQPTVLSAQPTVPSTGSKSKFSTAVPSVASSRPPSVPAPTPKMSTSTPMPSLNPSNNTTDGKYVSQTPIPTPGTTFKMTPQSAHHIKISPPRRRVR